MIFLPCLFFVRPEVFSRIVSYRFHSLSVRFTIQVLILPLFLLRWKSPLIFSFGKSGVRLQSISASRAMIKIFFCRKKIFAFQPSRKRLIKKVAQNAMRQNGNFYSGNKIHSFPLRSIDFFQISFAQKKFLFQKFLLKKFFIPKKIV